MLLECMIFLVYSLTTVTVLATLMSYTGISTFQSQPKFILKAKNNKAIDNSSIIKTFIMKSRSVAECLEHCLKDCRCQSFQICQNTKCQLCSSQENSSLLHYNDSCVYATYEMRKSIKTFQVICRIFEIFYCVHHVYCAYQILINIYSEMIITSFLHRNWKSNVQT